jgi:hypothetical protein
MKTLPALLLFALVTSTFAAPPVSPRHGPRNGIEVVRRWNQIALDASGLDHTPPVAGENRVFREQLGPCREARALAIVHIAMFDAMNAIVGEYKSYTGIRASAGPLSPEATISQAARDTLASLFPAQTATFNARLAEDLGAIQNKNAKANGIELGKRAAAAILALKADDHSDKPEPVLGIGHFTSNLPGRWRQDPVSLIPLALGAYWGECTPFVMEAGNQFRVPPPPALTSPEYAIAYDEVKRLGGDGVLTPTERTPEQTIIGIYWGYDGTPALSAPPKLYNQIALQIADQMGSDGIEVARLLALLNVAMADAGIAIWESKYFYDFWRPIGGIRGGDTDGNNATVGDPNFMPLGAPASNLQGPNFTPPFPAYPSGHAGFGAALFQILRNVYGTDNISFTFVSDEFNGITRGNDGNVRPLIPRSFSSFSEAEEENGQSRIYLGIHWAFDKTASIALGRQVGNYVFENTFTPLHRKGK